MKYRIPVFFAIIIVFQTVVIVVTQKRLDRARASRDEWIEMTIRAIGYAKECQEMALSGLGKVRL